MKLLAPAKINLFLHVTGRRPDGYHLLQSAFERIDWADEITLTRLAGPEIERHGDLLCPAQDDLGVRAARALQATPAWQARGRPGAAITIAKRVPAGAGLGGGSSDAASALMGLNELWGLGLTQGQLAEIGLSLGADVPFFISNLNAAFAQGVGEALTPYPSTQRWVVVAVPKINVPTKTIFGAPELTRNSKPLKIADFAQAALSPVWVFGRNDLEPVSCQRFPVVAQLVKWLKQAAASEGVVPEAVRMSGSGGAVICTAPSPEKAQAILNRMAKVQHTPDGHMIAHLRVCKTLTGQPEQSL
jgi:4-diphosphocytidyl-2-C-methyl-D-erythritol kinase